MNFDDEPVDFELDEFDKFYLASGFFPDPVLEHFGFQNSYEDVMDVVSKCGVTPDDYLFEKALNSALDEI
ncbi:hypothetical protein O6B97_04140 [Campylobacter ureolyticus]|uniref:hypothetical protein n=1 Tax=Campylobacter ureolyticus TaxID=827 RepID=UPI0022B37EF5|nr:hypothetical protein [Campylobacter ureolyticus]MCZ6186283.1 hypothetical protein [Campylobacter ureolyticus]